MAIIRKLIGYATTADLDKVGDIVKADGVTFEQFPMPLLGGHDHKLPIGKVVGAKKVGDGIVIEAHLIPLGESSTADDWAAAAKFGAVSAFSIGFKSVDAENNSHGGRTFKKTLVHEVSLVAVPANSKCVARYSEVNTDAAPSTAKVKPAADTPLPGVKPGRKETLIADMQARKEAIMADSLQARRQKLIDEAKPKRSVKLGPMYNKYK